MPTSTIYFRDNFFSSGITEIYNGKKERIGSLDLKSAFSSSVDVVNKDGVIVVKGHFPFFSRKWVISDEENREIGYLRQRFSFLAKKYEYVSENKGVFTIESEAFSREYRIVDDKEVTVAEFKRVSGFFESPVYRLVNQLGRIIERRSNCNSNGGQHDKQTK